MKRLQSPYSSWKGRDGAQGRRLADYPLRRAEAAALHCARDLKATEGTDFGRFDERSGHGNGSKDPGRLKSKASGDDENYYRTKDFFCTQRRSNCYFGRWKINAVGTQ